MVVFVNRKSEKIIKFLVLHGKVWDEGEKEIIVTITKANSFNYFDFIVETFKLAGTDWERSMGNQTGKPLFF